MKPSIQAKIISNSASNFIVSYNDDSSGADCDVQFWNPRPLDPDFRPAGDVCEASPSDWIYGTPNPRGQIALLAPLDGVDGMLASPTGFTKVWDDAGSGAKHDGTIWQMTPPSGFVALGHVITMGDPTPEPDPTNYWCISAKLVIAAEEGAQIWNDLSSGARTNVGIWRLVTADSARFVDLSTFFATLSHEPGTIENAFVLDPAAVQWVS